MYEMDALFCKQCGTGCALTASCSAQALLFVEELASIVLTPFVLYWSLPACVPAILAFVRDFTMHVDGVGDICSLAAFDFERHGNLKYGSPAHAPKVCLPADCIASDCHSVSLASTRALHH